MQALDQPGIVAPPPLIFAGCLAAGLALDALTGFLGISLPWLVRDGLAILCCVAGLYLLVGSLRLFRQAGTRVEPWRPTTALVTTGLYRRSRNPIYLGMALLHLGVALGLDAVFGLLALAPALILIRYGVIDREEDYLAAKFGEPYRRYLAEVRRWF